MCVHDVVWCLSRRAEGVKYESAKEWGIPVLNSTFITDVLYGMNFIVSCTPCVYQSCTYKSVVHSLSAYIHVHTYVCDHAVILIHAHSCNIHMYGVYICIFI